jgi:DNA polymerase elongation subunit (family B)
MMFGNVDSLFVKREGATRKDYEKLAGTIQRETGLPIALDNHYKFIVFMRQETHPDAEAMNHFFGKLMDGGFNCRGIELRRRDCPVFLKEFQKRLMEILFDADNKEEVVEVQIDKAKAFVSEVYHQIMSGSVDSEKLAVSKRVHKEVGEYRSMFPHVVAARHLSKRGKMLEEYASVDFVFLNAEHSNPLRRVLPVAMMSEGSDYYDEEKYGKMLLDVASTILKTFQIDNVPSLTLDIYL